MKIAMIQMNTLVGDIDGNSDQVLKFIADAHHQKMDLVVFPELTLIGYPPEDILFRESVAIRIERAIQKICGNSLGIGVVLGYPKRDAEDGNLYNTLGFIDGGQLKAEYYKQHLPNYLVFDEKRYFTPGSQPCLVDYKGFRLSLSICEDIWFEDSALQAKQGGADLIININASPFHIGKAAERVELLSCRAKQAEAAIVYVNLVGAQDELIFDGGTSIADKDGRVKVVGGFYSSSITEVTFYKDRSFAGEIDVRKVSDYFSCGQSNLALESNNHLLSASCALDDIEGHAYRALVIGVRDYVNKNGFPGVLLGLSGGIDSALTLAIAVDALGSERVKAVMMPFTYTSNMSLEDAEQEAAILGVDYRVRPIERIYEAFMLQLQADFTGSQMDATEENLQARIRGNYLMSLSNKWGDLVLTTGNKSEMAVGYATLYGDMAGGFDVLKDVAKSLVYRLARYRNALALQSDVQRAIIPERVIVRPPSAELRPEQTDQDTLPDYDELDQILSLYIEQDWSAKQIIAKGFDEAVVNKVIGMVDRNEYKRRQAAIGPRITMRGFGRDRRYPITARWPAGD